MQRSAVIVSLRVGVTPERAFAAFTEEIGSWWRENPLFRITSAGDGRLEFVRGEKEALVTHLPDGRTFPVGRILVWEPGARLVFEWKPESFAADQCTEVHVRFEPVDGETRVTVEHRGWDAIPRAHAARHGFPLMLFQRRAAALWHANLRHLDRALQP